jgi:hypothetical protein
MLLHNPKKENKMKINKKNLLAAFERLRQDEGAQEDNERRKKNRNGFAKSFRDFDFWQKRGRK